MRATYLRYEIPKRLKRFSSMGSQSFSDGQSWETLEHRTAISLHVGEDFGQIKDNMLLIHPRAS